MNVVPVVHEALSPDFPFGDSLEVLVRREDAEQFIVEVRGDDPEIASSLRIEERELDAGSPKAVNRADSAEAAPTPPRRSRGWGR
jgi:hypothetical protein